MKPDQFKTKAELIRELQSLRKYDGVYDITKRKQAEKDLKNNEHFLNSILESVQDGISVLNPDLTVRHINGIMNKWYKENLPLEGKKCYEVYHNADKPCDPCPTLRCLESGKTEGNIVTGLPGSPVEWIELFSYPIKDPNSDKVTRVVEFVRDITERKQAEEQLSRQYNQSQRLLDTGRQLTASLEINTVLNRVADEIQTLLGCKGVTVYMLDDQGQMLIPIIAYDPPYEEQVLSAKIDVDKSYAGQVVKSMKGIIVNFADQQPGGYHIPGTPVDEDHLIVAPFTVNDKVIGVISIYRQHELFQEEDLALVESFTLFASIAINNARIHQELIGQIAERKQAEEALRKSAEKYKDLTENLNVGVYRNTIGSKGKFIELNSAFVKMFGYDSKDEIGQLNVSDLYQDADDRAVFNKKMVKSGYVSNEELNLIKKDGTPFIGSISSVAVKDKNGKVKYYDGIVENITERKRVEAALRESEARNKAIVAALPDIIFRMDADGRFVDVAVNDPNLLLIPPEKVLGKKARKILPPDLAELTEIKIRETLRTGQMQVFEYDLGLGNEIRNFEARMVTCSENEVMSIIRDNTERKRAEEALKERERFHRGLLDDMVSFVAVLKPDGEVIFVNNTPLKVGGFELEDVVGQKFYNCAWWTHSDEVRQTVKKYIEQCACGETLIHDIQIQTTDGSLMWIEYSMHPYFDKNGSVIYLIPEGRDITERKQAEEEREQALQEARQANKVKDLFLANMSHEIRTPLNSILGFAEIIEQHFKGRMDEEENEYFQIVNSSGQRLINTVHDILDISRIEAGVFPDNPRVVRLATPIESIFKEFRPVAGTKNLEFTYDNQIDDGAVKVDEACIVKAVSNLVDNAIKFTEEGQIKILLNEQNSKYVLAISDTGIGIGADYLNQLYDAFSQESTGYTKKYQGLGLGLSIAKSCLDMNDVQITVESKQGVGTTFNLTFTPADAVIAEPDIKTVHTGIEVEKTVSKAKPVILLVENDLHNRKTLEVILKGKYETPYAVSVNEAKKQLREYQVNLIILDLSLEGDEDGLDLVAYMKAKDGLKDIPVIAVTAHAFTTDRDNVFKAGCNAYMSKPINIQKLLGMISEYC